MRDLRARNIFPDYKACPGERHKLLTNDKLLVGPSDSNWHHPLLANIDVAQENSNISKAALKRKREKDRERRYSS